MTLKRLWSAPISASTTYTVTASAVILLSFLALNSVTRHFPGDPFRDGKNMLFLLSGALLGSFWVGRIVDPFLGLAHAAMVVLWGYNRVPLYGLIEITMPLVMLGLATFSAKREALFLAVLRITVYVQIALSLFQWAGFTTFGANDPAFLHTLQGSFGNQIVTGCFFAMVAPVAFRFWRGWEGVLISLFCLFTFSSMGVLSLGGALLYFIWRIRGRDAIYLGALALTVCILGAVLLPEWEFFSISGRQVPFRRAWELIRENPYGYGPGSWLGLYHEWQVPYRRVWSPMHSDFLQLLFEGGAATLLFFLLGCARVLKRIEPWAGSALFAFLVNALGAFPMHLSALSYLAVTFLVLGQKGRTIKATQT